jgi:hypothetical protein
MNFPSDDKITIIEGPTPVFEHAPESWLLGLTEGPRFPRLALTRLRTLSGPAMVERCWKAWHNQHPIALEFRAEDGETLEAEIVAVRYTEVPEGHVLLLYVRLP